MSENSHQRHPLTNASLRRAFDARSRTSSASSLDSDYIGHIEPTTTSFRPIIFNAASKVHHPDHAGADPIVFETPPDSGAENNDSQFESDFDDKRLPAEHHRRSSSPGLGGGEPGGGHDGQGRRRTLSGIEGIKVELESVKERGQKTGRYVLKVDDKLRELLAAGAREQRREEARKGEKGRRRRFGDLVFTQRFTTFDRGSPETEKSPFRGFFVLMWLGVVILMMKTAAENYRSTGRVFGADILSIMFRPTYLFDCLLMDATMFYGSTLWNVPLQRAVQNGTLSWNRSGWILQSIWQIFFICGLISYTLYKEWPWIQTVFLVLHTIVVLMKQHSYAFYNGYLSEVFKRRELLEKQLDELKEENPVAVSSAVQMADSHDIPPRPHRRRSSMGLDLTNLPDELSPKQSARFAAILKSETDACDMELSLEASNSPKVTYPSNLTYWNYLEYLHFPTVVYELTYPRTSGINWSYVAEKTAATFGVLGIMIAVSQQSIYPVVMSTRSLQSLPIQDRLAEFPWILLKLVFPFMMEYLCVWYLIWELILNLLAELTRFSDRGFYRDWWNSTTWDAFARDWNVPVHNFLLRHVYHSSISTFQISREAATLVTFAISAVVHELVMWCIFGKLRGYLLCGQMLQLPLVQLSRTRWLKGREVLGNVLFWIGIWTGPSFLCAIYLVL